jgi:hypothetical protein
MESVEIWKRLVMVTFLMLQPSKVVSVAVTTMFYLKSY